MTIFYPDVSNNNWGSTQDLIAFLSQLHGEGFAGVVHKVSEGNYYADPYWQPCRQWCEANNLSWLGYHYVTLDDPASQVEVFTRNNGGLNVMLDFEAGSGGMANLWAVTDAFNQVGVNVALAYIPNWYLNGEAGGGDLSALAGGEIALVSSAYPGGTGCAADIYGAAGGDSGEGWDSYNHASPVCWQFTDHASIGGLTVDCNAYKGNNLDALFTG